MKVNWNFSLILILFSAAFKDTCLGAKLERKQDFFDVEPYDPKRGGYRLSEIGKRGFTSTLGFDYRSSTSQDFPSDLSRTSSGSDEVLSPARDLIPPPVYRTTSSPSSSSRVSDYSKYGSRISTSSSSSPTSSKDFHSSTSTFSPYRTSVSRRQRQSSTASHFYDDTSPTTSMNSRYNPATFSLVADPEGKLIGYRGSILPGFDSTQSIISSSPSISDATNFIGGYYSGHPKYSSHSHHHRGNLAASPSTGRYSSTPVYYPGKEEDHTYRMRDSSSQGYDDDDSPGSSEDNEFTYQPHAPFSHSHGSAYLSDGILGPKHHHNMGFLPYARDRDNLPGGFSYGPLGKNQRLYDFPTKRFSGPPPATSSSTYDSVESTTPSYGFPPLYPEYAGSSPI